MARPSTRGPRFHLYDDALDELSRRGKESPVYLRLEVVQAQLETLDSGGASVTLTLSRELARALGQLPVEDTPGSTASL